MNTYAFIGHFLSTPHFCELIGWPGSLLRSLPKPWLKQLIRALPPYEFLKLVPLAAPSGSSAQGYGIIAPLLPEDLVTWGEQAVLQKVIAAGRLAERLGAKIVGLAGFTSVVGNEGEELARHLQIAVTSGNSFTAALALQGLRKGADLMEIPLREATVAVIGATGDIGSICTKILATEVKRLHLAARNAPRLEEFALQVQRDSGCQVHVMKYIRDAVRDADLILTATSAITTLIEAQDVKPGAVVCDVAIPHNVGNDLIRDRDDVLVFEGGMTKLPMRYMERNKRWSYLSPDSITVFGCLAETMVLALEGRFESFSLGRGRITPERIKEIETMADTHGFRLADFRYGDMVWTTERLQQIRANAKRHSRQITTEAINT